MMKAIVAMSRDRVIGCDGAVPWRLPEDLRWFKRATLGQAVLMGRRTFESIGGRPLPGRLNLVATRGNTLDADGVTIVRELAGFRAADYAPREVWVIGGAEIYARLLPGCSEVYLSMVEGEFAGDTFMPTFEVDFPVVEVLARHKGFEVRRYRRNPPPVSSHG